MGTVFNQGPGVCRDELKKSDWVLGTGLEGSERDY